MSIRNTPTPFDPNIPIVTPGGGTAAAYKDPNSPESLMKKTVIMNAQAAVDSTYDVKEGFTRRFQGNVHFFFLSLVLLFVIFMMQDRFTQKKSKTVLWFIFALAILLLLRSVHITE